MFDWRKLKAHPEADKFPLMAGMDLVNLAGNIQAKGQVFPVIITDEETPRILDGRNRLAAFRMLESKGADKKEPWIETYSGEMSPKDYVRAVNWERMHLNGAQRAALAAEMIADPIVGGKLKEDAKKSQGTRTDLTSATIVANVEPGKVTAKAAATMGVHPRQVERADLVRRENPEGFQRLKEGKSTVNAEVSKLKKPTKKEQKTAEDISFLDKLKGFFNAASAFKGLIAELKLVIHDVPKTLSDESRAHYLAAISDLQEQLTLLFRKLQGGT